jgi:imidazolonepropionase-like amidohydrolase
MKKVAFARLFSILSILGLLCIVAAQSQELPNTELINGQWFNGQSFDPRTVYSMDGRFTFHRPSRIDRTVDLAGTWIVPPFGEAHSHTIGKGVEESDQKAIQEFLRDGVFYVKIQANLPLTDEMKRRLAINRRDGPDVIFAGAPLTATGGHPSALHRDMLKTGAFPGYTSDRLKDHTYFVIDSESDLDQKWPRVLELRPDFIKTILVFSDEFEKRKDQEIPDGLKGLDPRLLPRIVEKAHAAKLHVSTHVMNTADFHAAVAAGTDEIAHLPFATDAIMIEDAKLAARRGIVVDTTCGMIPAIPRRLMPEAIVPQVVAAQKANLRLLRESGVRLAIGSDIIHSAVKEFDYLEKLGVFDNLTLLKMWTETTAQTIFPDRKIGELREGYEASFVALEGNPLDDLMNVHRIKLRFKQGMLIQFSN